MSVKIDHPIQAAPPMTSATTATTACATCSGYIQWSWRITPQYCHDASRRRDIAPPNFAPNSLPVGPGRTMVERTPVPSSSICTTRARPSSPALAAV